MDHWRQWSDPILLLSVAIGHGARQRYGNHALLLFGVQFGVNRESQHFRRRALGFRKRSGRVSQVRETWLQRQAQRVVYFPSNVLTAKLFDQLAAFGRPNDILVVDADALGQDEWGADVRPLEGSVVDCRVPPAAFRPTIQVRQFDQQDSGLNRVEPEIPTDVTGGGLRLRS